MEEDASLMSGIKDRHCAMDDAIYHVNGDVKRLESQCNGGAAEADSRRLEQARHVGTRGTTLLFVAKPASHTWAQKASKDMWQQGNQCFPVLGVSIIHREGLLLRKERRKGEVQEGREEEGREGGGGRGEEGREVKEEGRKEKDGGWKRQEAEKEGREERGRR